MITGDYETSEHKYAVNTKLQTDTHTHTRAHTETLTYVLVILDIDCTGYKLALYHASNQV